MPIRSIPAHTAAVGDGAGAAVGTDVALLETVAGDFKASSLTQIGALVGAPSGSNASFDIRTFGAAGDGVADDTAAFQSAINSGHNFFVSPGIYSVNTLNLPFNAGCSIVGTSMWRCIIRGRTAGTDVFRWRHGGNIGNYKTSDRVGIHFEGLRIEVNAGTGADTDINFHRCTPDGMPVGACGIAFDRTNFSAGNVAPTFGQQYLPAYQTYRHVSFGKVGTAAGVGAIHFQGPAPFTSLHNVVVDGALTTGITFGLPWVHRVTPDSGTDVFTIAAGATTDKVVNGHQVLVRAHQARGSQPGGVSNTTIFTVSDKSGSTFKLTGVNVSSAGSNVFVMPVGDALGECVNEGVCIGPAFLSPGILYGMSLPNPLGVQLLGCKIYGAKTALHIASFGSNLAVGVYIACGHFPGPLTALSSDPFIKIEAFGLSVDGMLYTGGTSGKALIDLDGADHYLAAITGKQNGSGVNANLPILDLGGANTFVHGAHPTNGDVEIGDVDEVRGRIRVKEGATNHLNQMGNWGQEAEEEEPPPDPGPAVGIISEFRGEDGIDNWPHNLNVTTPQETHTLADVTSPASRVFKGTQSWQHEIQPGDAQWSGDTNSGSPKRRVELSCRGGASDFPRIADGTVGWFGCAFFLPSDPMDDVKGCSIFQLHNNPDAGVTMQTFCFGGRLKIEMDPSFGVELANVALAPFLDKWNTYVCQYKGSTGADGFIRIWINDVQLVNRSGKNKQSGSKAPYVKLGTYYWGDGVFDSLATGRALAIFDNLRLGNASSNFDSVNPNNWGA